ncbi:MAG TPA: hypothetical protein VK186_24200 [Candidatus Deferrimicrobium sp.]|nr:hypothetical protein [Candidatus Deferrimicrobium sp.]
MSNGNRSQITKITVEFDDGTQKTYPENGYMPVALFWGDGAVTEILGSFYENLSPRRHMTYEKLEKHFGPIRANLICPGGPNTTAEINKNVVTTIWNTPNQTTYPQIMSKDPGCDLGG